MLPDSAAYEEQHGPHEDKDCWPQLLIEWPSWDTAEATAVRRLQPALATAEHEGRLDRWFFVRKYPYWRLRYLGGTAARSCLVHTLEESTITGEVARWVHGVYEPETLTFGGDAGMVTAHKLFHSDSHHVLAYLSRQTTADGPREPGRRELGVLLISALLRGADLDWYEQGDVWARIARLRRVGRPSPGHQQQRHKVQHLMTVDAARAAREGPLTPVRSWIGAFEAAGHELVQHALHGRLNRGLRAVLAHHGIFAWNRLGLPAREQNALSELATYVVMNEHDQLNPDL